MKNGRLLNTPRRRDRALEHAAEILSTEGRHGPKIVLLLTAGDQVLDKDEKSLTQAAQPLRRLGVRVYVVAVGQNLTIGELLPVVNKEKDIFPVVLPGQLPKLANSVAKSSKKHKISFK